MTKLDRYPLGLPSVRHREQKPTGYMRVNHRVALNLCVAANKAIRVPIQFEACTTGLEGTSSTFHFPVNRI